MCMPTHTGLGTQSGSCMRRALASRRTRQAPHAACAAARISRLAKLKDCIGRCGSICFSLQKLPPGGGVMGVYSPAHGHPFTAAHQPPLLPRYLRCFFFGRSFAAARSWPPAARRAMVSGPGPAPSVAACCCRFCCCCCGVGGGGGGGGVSGAAVPASAGTSMQVVPPGSHTLCCH